MKNQKMLLLVLVSITLVFSLIPSVSTARASATLHLPDDHSITHSVMYSSSFALSMVLNTPEGNVTPFVDFEAGDLGIKTGDWIKFEYRFTGLPAGEPYLEWLKLEFLGVEGTNASVRVTMHISDGTEQSDTVPFDLAAGGGERLAGFVIPANLTIGDSVYMTGYGNVTIEDETIRPYAGARRTVVYTSFSQDEIQYTYYWDKQTGVMVEAEGSMPSFGYNITFTANVTETNMWETAATRMPWWLWAIIAIAIAAVGFTVYRLKKRKTSTTLIKGN